LIDLYVDPLTQAVHVASVLGVHVAVKYSPAGHVVRQEIQAAVVESAIWYLPAVHATHVGVEIVVHGFVSSKPRSQETVQSVHG
jgi:hypothetical protein